MAGARLVTELLGPGPSPEQLLLALDGEAELLVGNWGGGGAVLLRDPQDVVRLDAQAPFPVLPQPDVGGANPDAIGGGWFGAIPYSGTTEFRFYDHVLRLRDGQWWFETLWTEQRANALAALRERYRRLLADGVAIPVPQLPMTFGGAERAAHLAAVESAVELIRAGEVYQVNICTRLSAALSDAPHVLFAHAASELKPVYGAYLRGATGAVLSFSPELFVRRRGRQVTSSPIKGTRPRDVPADELRRSTKDAAENVMIVDLMRNDLGRVSETGSVHPTALLQIEAHPGVWQLVSTVTSTLRADVDDARLLDATFPPGSVTGAPKLRAMQAIGDLETQPRQLYTGAIGYLSPCWGAEFSVAIRTFEVTGERTELNRTELNRIELGVGSGITADSVPMLEWREVLHKATPLLAALGARVDDAVLTPPVAPTPAQLAGGLLETILALDGVPLRLADHLARLDRCSRELYGHGCPPDLARRAVDAVRGLPGRIGLRLVLAPDGTASVEARPAASSPAASEVWTTNGRGGLWRHKWADRSQLSADEATRGTPLYVAGDGTVLETSRGNVFLLEDDGTLVTPPLRDDLLPGITRRALLDLARDEGRAVRLRSFTVAQMLAAGAFWTSSLSLAVPIVAVDGTPLARHDSGNVSSDIERFAQRLREADSAARRLSADL
ncbi:MAG TPA: chorismate-binding protein [Jatrophihabitans sp.]